MQKMKKTDVKEVETKQEVVDTDMPKCACDTADESEKKDENLEEVEPLELSDEQRKLIIDEYNKSHPESYIEYEKPTKEEVKGVADYYTEEVTKFNAKKFTIADKNNALRVARFLEKWNENDVQWEGEGWKGAVYFDIIVKDFIDKFKLEEQDFVIDYGTLTYLYGYMRNYRGVGLKGAMRFSKTAEEYNKILDVVGSEFEKHTKEGEEIKKLQDRWQAYENGFKLKYKEIPEMPNAETEKAEA